MTKSASYVSRSQVYLAKQKRVGWSIGFNSWTNWTLYGIRPRCLCKIRRNDVSEKVNCWDDCELMLMALHAYSRVYALFLAFHSLVYRWRCQFLSLFSQDNEHKERTDGASLLPKSLSSFRIHSTTLQAYTQPYSFGGRIKLIVCQIRHELSVTIHEISRSWKKTLDGGPNILEE